MAGKPYNLLFQAAVENAIIAVAPILTGLVNEAGQTVTVPLRAAGTELKTTYPIVFVSVQPGKLRPFGHSYVVKYDATSGLYICAAKASGSRILFTVNALNDSERRFLIDALISGIASDYAVSANGTVTEQAISQLLLSVGILFNGDFDEVQYPDSDPQAPRQDGQVFSAVLPMICDIDVQWTRPPLINPGTTVQPSVTLTDEPASQSPIYWPSTDNPEPSAPITW